jgi:hypothetical protein
MSDALIVFEENDPLKASTTNDNNNFLLNKITETAQRIENEISTLETRLTDIISSSSAPIGSIIMWSSTNIPENWLAMVGQDISNEAYAELRNITGKTSLPDTRNRVPQGNATPLNYISAGLPNIIGHMSWGPSHAVSSSGCFWFTNQEGAPHGTENDYFPTVTQHFEASRSNPIYGASNTVQPPAVTVVFIIKYK